jgi:hypothetical protein
MSVSRTTVKTLFSKSDASSSTEKKVSTPSTSANVTTTPAKDTYDLETPGIVVPIPLPCTFL